jgi:hypothetical protein
MTTYFLRFSDEAAAQTALETAGIYVPEIGNNPGYYKQADIGWAFDPIGTISEGGVYDQETGEELVAPTVLEGWHANYVGELPEGLEDYLVFPENPVRKFAGVD